MNDTPDTSDTPERLDEFMNLEQQLGDLLRRDAATLPLRAPGASVVKRRARQRQLRHRAGIAAVAAGVIGAAATTVSRIGDDDGTTNVAEGGEQIGTGEGGGTGGGEAVAPRPAGGGQPAAVTSPTGFDVKVVPGTFGFAQPGVVDNAGRSYVLSTAPAGGQVDENGQGLPTLYTSTDGAVWDVASGFMEQVPWANNLTTSGDRIYAIGTAPAVDADGLPADTAQVGWSSDGGGSWTTQEFAIDFPAPATTLPFEGRFVNTSIAASGTGSLAAVVNATWQLDFASLLPAELSYPSFTDEGVDIIRAESCEGSEVCSETLVEQYTWADIGLTGQEDTRRTFIYTSTDGVNWAPASVDFGPADATTVVGTSSGFFATVTTWESASATTATYVSADGTSWQPGGDLPAVLGVDYVDQIGVTGNRVIAASYPGRIALSDDGGLTWQPGAEVPWQAEMTSLTTIGPLGIAALVDDGTSKAVWLSADGTSWELVTDIDPADLTANPYPAALTVGANHVAVTFTDVYTAPDGSPGESVAIVATPRR